MRRFPILACAAAAFAASCAAVGVERNIYWAPPASLTPAQADQVTRDCQAEAVEERRVAAAQPDEDRRSEGIGYGNGVAEPLIRMWVERDRNPTASRASPRGECYAGRGFVPITLTYPERQAWLALDEAGRQRFLRSIAESDPSRIQRSVP